MNNEYANNEYANDEYANDELEAHENVQEVGLAGTGNLEAIAVAHDYFASLAADILLYLPEVDEGGMVDAEEMIVTEQVFNITK